MIDYDFGKYDHCYSPLFFFISCLRSTKACRPQWFQSISSSSYFYFFSSFLGGVLGLDLNIGILPNCFPLRSFSCSSFLRINSSLFLISSIFLSFWLSASSYFLIYLLKFLNWSGSAFSNSVNSSNALLIICSTSLSIQTVVIFSILALSASLSLTSVLEALNNSLVSLLISFSSPSLRVSTELSQS